MDYSNILQKRRALRIDGYKTLADIGMDVDRISPIQLSSCSLTGPCLIGHYWWDEENLPNDISQLREIGYLPNIPFNKVINEALKTANLGRDQVYITQAFHLIPLRPPNKIPTAHIDKSFREVTSYEVRGRNVIALGSVAADACNRHGVQAQRICSPSSRYSVEYKVKTLADALQIAAGAS